MRRGLSLALALVGLGAAVWAQEDLARVALQEAWGAYGLGRFGAALTLVRQAEDFDPTFSDIPVIRGLAQSGLSYHARLDLGRRALERERFAVVPPHHAVRLYAEALVRLGRFEEAEGFLGRREETGFHSDLAALRIHSLLALGREEAARQLLNRARQRFPLDRALAPYLIRFAEEAEWSRVLEAALSDPRWWSDQGWLVLSLLPSGAAVRARVLRELSRRLPDDPDVAAHLLGLRLITWEEASRLWARSGPPARLDLAQAVSRLAPSREAWLALATSRSGRHYRLLGPLSYGREEYHYVNGRLSRVGVDEDGDGRPEQEWEWAPEGPRTWRGELQSEAGEVAIRWRLDWDTYPRLAALEREVLSSPLPRRVHRFSPTAELQIGPQSLSLGAFPGVEAVPLTSPDVGRAAALAIRVEDYDAHGRLRRRWRLEGGKAYLVEEDRLGLGQRDTVVLFREGQVERVWRDLEGKGNWSLVTHYRDGQPSQVVFQDGGLRLLREGWEEGLVVVAVDGALWPAWQRGWAVLTLPTWEGRDWPRSLAGIPHPPFDSLGGWP